MAAPTDLRHGFQRPRRRGYPSSGGAGNIYVHHNYGSFGSGFIVDSAPWNGGWGYMYASGNVPGASVPN
jgi:hypothetical protein